MQPLGYIRPLYAFKGIRFKQRRKLVDKYEKKVFKRPHKNRYVDRSMKRGEKHLFRIFLNRMEE